MAMDPATVDDRSFRMSVDEYQSVSLAVAMGVSDILGVDPCSLPPISHSINTDALDALFADSASSSDDRRWPRIVFEYCDMQITIDNSGIVIFSGPAASVESSSAAVSECGSD